MLRLAHPSPRWASNRIDAAIGNPRCDPLQGEMREKEC